MTTPAAIPAPCGCGCGELVVTQGARFRPGHFARVLPPRPLRMCAAPGCESPTQSQASWSKVPYCRFHYTRLSDTGDIVLQPRRSTWDRFVERVMVLADGCWSWMAGRTGRGHVYGQFWFNNGTGLAHRYAYETMVGPIPAGLQIDHLCRNQRCVNPAHLEPVTNRENMRRMRVAKKGAQ